MIGDYEGSKPREGRKLEGRKGARPEGGQVTERRVRLDPKGEGAYPFHRDLKLLGSFVALPILGLK